MLNQCFRYFHEASVLSRVPVMIQTLSLLLAFLQLFGLLLVQETSPEERKELAVMCKNQQRIKEEVPGPNNLEDSVR